MMKPLKIAFIAFLAFSTFSVINVHAIIGDLLETAGRAASGAVDVATGAAHETVDIVTGRPVPERRVEVEYYTEQEAQEAPVYYYQEQEYYQEPENIEG